MIIKERKGNALKGPEKHIAFAINTDGVNTDGFAWEVANIGWEELSNLGPCILGTIFSKEIGDKTYHGLVCHELIGGAGWKDAKTVIKECFDKIDCPDNEEIATIAIGEGPIGELCGANSIEIRNGMEASNKTLVLYRL